MNFKVKIAEKWVLNTTPWGVENFVDNFYEVRKLSFFGLFCNPALAKKFHVKHKDAAL